MFSTAAHAALPDLGYVRISGGSRRFYELRVASEDGTGATTLYSTRDVGQMMIRMGPRADNTIIVIQGGRFSLLRYTNTFSGPQMLSFEPLVTISTASGAAPVDFSPNGKDVAYAGAGGTSINIFNLDTRASRTIAQLPSYTRGLSFSHDGSQVYYLENVSTTDAVLKRVPVAGGPAVSVGIEGDYNNLTIGRTTDSVLTSRKNVRYDDLSYFVAGSTTPTVIATGYVPSFRCDDTKIIYQKANSDNTPSLLRRDMTPTGYTFTFSSTGNYWPSYISTC